MDGVYSQKGMNKSPQIVKIVELEQKKRRFSGSHFPPIDHRWSPLRLAKTVL